MTAKPLARHELLAEEQPESTQTAPAAPLNRDSAEWRIGEGGATSCDGDPSTAIEKVESPLTKSAIERCLKVASAEFAANREYERGRYDPEKGGPALARLNELRHLQDPDADFRHPGFSLDPRPACWPFDPSPRPLETSANGFRYCLTCDAPVSVAPGHDCIPAPKATVVP